MTEFWAVLTLQGVVVAIVSGFVFGLALPGLFRALVERLIPDEQIDALNAAAGHLVPVLVIPMGAAFLAGQTLNQGSPGFAAGRFALWCIFVLAMTIGDLLIQRLRGQGVSRVSERIQAIDAQAEASDRRRLAIIDSQTDAQRAASKR
jgi:hypothetical protein